MSSAVGHAALILTTNSAQAKSGLSGFLGYAGGWAGKAAAVIGGAAAGLFTFNAAAEKIQATAKLGAAADAFGITAEAFSGIAGVANSAGEDTKEFIESLVTLGQLSVDGANGAEGASKWFKDLGLNAKEFAALPIDEKFLSTFEAINKLPPGQERVNALMKAFGTDGGKLLLPLLSKAPEELRKMASGFAISSDQMARARAANEALARASNVLSRTWQTVAVAFAPVITVAADLLTKFQPAFEWAGRASEAFFSTVGAMLREVVDWLADAATGIGGFVAEWVGLGSQVPTVGEVINGTLRWLTKGWAMFWDVVKAGAGGVAFVLGIVVEALGEFVNAMRLIDPATFEPIGDALEESGRAMKAWGKQSIALFGESARGVDAWFDQLLIKKPAAAAAATAKAAGQAAEAVLKDMKNEALIMGSTAEVSARMKNDFGPSADKQLAEQKKANQFHAAAVATLKAINEKFNPYPSLLPL